MEEPLTFFSSCVHCYLEGSSGALLLCVNILTMIYKPLCFIDSLSLDLCPQLFQKSRSPLLYIASASLKGLIGRKSALVCKTALTSMSCFLYWFLKILPHTFGRHSELDSEHWTACVGQCQQDTSRKQGWHGREQKGKLFCSKFSTASQTSPFCSS